MPKAKPVSLHPLTFEEAIKALIHSDSPERIGIISKRPKKRRSKYVKTAKAKK